MTDATLTSKSSTASAVRAHSAALGWAAANGIWARLLRGPRSQVLHLDAEIDDPRLRADVGVEPAQRRDIERWIGMMLRHMS